VFGFALQTLIIDFPSAAEGSGAGFARRFALTMFDQ
jgi:hypothetical protein